MRHLRRTTVLVLFTLYHTFQKKQAQSDFLSYFCPQVENTFQHGGHLWNFIGRISSRSAAFCCCSGSAPGFCCRSFCPSCWAPGWPWPQSLPSAFLHGGEGSPGLWPPGSASAPPLPERWPLSCSFWGCCCGSSVRRKAGCPGLPKPLAAEWACSKNGC